MRFETAGATRHCFRCESHILKGEEHLARYVRGGNGFKKRINFCMLCALRELSYNVAIEGAVKYLREHEKTTNRLLLMYLKKDMDMTVYRQLVLEGKDTMIRIGGGE